MEFLWDGGTQIFSNGPGFMSKMAAIYGKTWITFFSGTKQLMTMKAGIQYRVLEGYQICSNADPGLTLTYSTASQI